MPTEIESEIWRSYIYLQSWCRRACSHRSFVFIPFHLSSLIKSFSNPKQSSSIHLPHVPLIESLNITMHSIYLRLAVISVIVTATNAFTVTKTGHINQASSSLRSQIGLSSAFRDDAFTEYNQPRTALTGGNEIWSITSRDHHIA